LSLNNLIAGSILLTLVRIASIYAAHAVPPGDYILDVQDAGLKATCAQNPQPFKVISNQTVRVDMDIDTGVR
jgi:hypothetical protein